MEDILKFFGVMMSIMVAAGGGYAVIALVSAWAKRLERRGGATDPALEGEVARLRERVHELEGAEERLAELEERLDFAERMLTQARDARLGAGEGR
jgi:hypothetical protein